MGKYFVYIVSITQIHLTLLHLARMTWLAGTVAGTLRRF
jgi:hypothetical protein